jgi:orotidine-5'-phosphate decarboxylase
MIHDSGSAGIFLDLKLHDIPVTVQCAMDGISQLDVTFTTVHCGESLSMLEAAVAGSQGRVGVLGVTLLTSVTGDHIREAGFRPEFVSDPAALVLQRALMARKAGCVGVVCSGGEAAMIKTALGEDFLTVTPGIRPAWSELQQDDQRRVVTPAIAIQNGSDYLVIGRPIRATDDPVRAVQRIAEEIAGVL